MSYTFEEEASRDQVWLRAFFMGPTGSGKSKGALELASKLFNGELPTTLINTEKGRGKLYADRYRFSYIGMDEVGDFSPEAYIRAIDLAEQKHPGGIFILDSVSHEWMGNNGILQQADRFGDWKTVRPKHNAWVDRLLAVHGHLIVTCRAKMKYEVGEEEVGGRKRQVITMLGVGPIQSDDLQYEFNLVGRFEQETKIATFSGHVDPLQGTTADLDDATDVAETLTQWLSEGSAPVPVETAEPEKVEELRALLLEEGRSEAVIEERFAVARRQNRGQLHPDYVAKNISLAKDRLAAKARRDAKPDPDAKPTEEPAEAQQEQLVS